MSTTTTTHEIIDRAIKEVLDDRKSVADVAKGCLNKMHPQHEAQRAKTGR